MASPVRILDPIRVYHNRLITKRHITTNSIIAPHLWKFFVKGYNVGSSWNTLVAFDGYDINTLSGTLYIGLEYIRGLGYYVFGLYNIDNGLRTRFNLDAGLRLIVNNGSSDFGVGLSLQQKIYTEAVGHYKDDGTLELQFSDGRTAYGTWEPAERVYQRIFVGFGTQDVYIHFGVFWNNKIIQLNETENHIIEKPEALIDASFYNGTNYIDLITGNINTRDSEYVYRVPSEQKWLWLVEDATTDGLVHLRFFPEGSTVRFLDPSSLSVVSETSIDSDDVSLSLSEGTYNIIVEFPEWV